MNKNVLDGSAAADLIKSQLQRAFKDKASEDLPSSLLSLIDKLKAQDEQNGK